MLNNTTFIYYVFFILSSSGRHLSFSYILAIVSSAAMNMGLHIFLQDAGFNVFGYLPRSEIDGLYDSSFFFEESPHCFPQ